jgi:hypothetical protein
MKGNESNTYTHVRIWECECVCVCVYSSSLLYAIIKQHNRKQAPYTMFGNIQKTISNKVFVV